ncbi:hypothetical protein HED50_11165 [Ochrobactrum oryzae]|nr:hypothetical protein [Brucella oryzae]
MSDGIARPEPPYNEKVKYAPDTGLKAISTRFKARLANLSQSNDWIENSSFCALAKLSAHLLCTHLQHWQEV